MKQLLFLFTFICCILCKTYSQGNDVTFISGSAKPSFTDALEGLKSYNFQCISNGQEIGERASFIDAFFIEQMKIYMENICPDAIFGIDYKYPSCTHATIVAQYNHTTKMNWSGIWQWVVTNVRVTFRFGLSNQYIYTFTLPNFKQNGNDFSGGNVCNSLIKNVSQYRHRYNYNKVIKLQSYKTKWTESSLRQYYSTNADMVEGIYESTVSANDATHNKYKLGLKKMQDGNYALIYLGGANLFDDWKEGEIKAFLTPTGSTGVYKAKWLLSNKEITDDYYVILKTNSLSVKDTEENELYLKLYPRAEMLAKNKISSGTGFFLNKNGYIITNYHVIENAKTIKVSGINDNYKNSYTARVEISDKQNDLAILKITDKSFKPIANIPYTFKYTT